MTTADFHTYTMNSYADSPPEQLNKDDLSHSLSVYDNILSLSANI